MIIIDDINEVIDKIHKISDPQVRSQVTSGVVLTAIASSVYYIVLGIVVIVLGRRIVNATQKAWRESRRTPG